MLTRRPTLRHLTASQEATARSVFGSSLDFSTVFISDKTGLGGLPFTIASFGIQVMNLGTFGPSRNLLIHELSHVWQSQHSSPGTAFMKNSVEGQALAVVRNKAAALFDPTLKTNADYPLHFPYSTYAYLPGKPFSDYGAEQIANQIEHGVSSIVSHAASVVPGARDSDNELSLRTPLVEDRRLPGVMF